MIDSKDRSSSIGKLGSNELPDDFAIHSPHTWLWVLQILISLLGCAVLINIMMVDYFPYQPIIFFIGILLILYMCAINIMIVKSHSHGIINLKLLCGVLVVAALPNLFLQKPLISIIPILSGASILWIIKTQKFKLFLDHKSNMMKWINSIK